MSAEVKRALVESNRRNAFWPCLGVFLLLACEHGIGLKNLWAQHQQLQQTRALQDQNLQTLYQARELSAKVQDLSLDLLAVANTNAAARQIVQDFGIKWNPGPAAAPAAAPATNSPK